VLFTGFTIQLPVKFDLKLIQADPVTTVLPSPLTILRATATGALPLFPVYRLTHARTREETNRKMR